MAQYAAKTEVTADKSRREIEATLTRYGADEFGYATSRDRAMVAFTAHGRQVRFTLALPDPAAPEFTRTPTGQLRSRTGAVAAHEQATRQRWRALALVIKAKLEAVEAGIVEFDQEFLAHLVLPGGVSVYEQVRDGIALAYETGDVRPLLAIDR